jgi:uncharacterized protein (TIGR02453 family)
MAREPHFGPVLFRFLADLRRHNDRTWFQAHRKRYEAQVRDPCLRFIADFAPRLEKISPHFLADPRPVGGSLFRIHRDVRFGRDKRPYKTHAGIHFRHADADGAHAPGFYLHLEPGSSFLGIGIWHPDAPSAARIRDAILDDPARWQRILARRPFRTAFALAGESLKRPPHGVPPAHPLACDLLRKDFIAIAELSEREVCAADFLDRFQRRCNAGAAFAAFLADALLLPW